ncbi:MAG: hypothetical protein WA688_02925 [Thermoplasmata archaeon]
MPTDQPTLRLELFVPGVATELAFDHFFSELATALHSNGYRFEPGHGGGLFELGPRGDEREFARVTVWERGREVAFAWNPVARELEAPTVPVVYRFQAIESGAKISIE